VWNSVFHPNEKVQSLRNRVLKRIFGIKRRGVTRGQGKQHNEEHHMCIYLQISELD
jgi:hypothetical protein